ncbi:hypothetical protein TWF730_003138 [Orbilia blumenaviensis]|uniref:Hydrophobin n=1 Tax=Orbilia blumenaviensis TaxID=1796055 RepID=A0AAV9U5B1_9PEZI
MARSILNIFVFLLFLLSQANSTIIPPWSLPLGLGEAPPPEKLWTKNPSPECQNINKGERLCCAAAVSGGFPLVQKLTGLGGYKMPANTLNGYLCHKSATCTSVEIEVCCLVTILSPIWGLWCQTTAAPCTSQ